MPLFSGINHRDFTDRGIELDDNAVVLELNGLVATGTIDEQDPSIEYGSEVFDSHFIMNVPKRVHSRFDPLPNMPRQ